MKKVCKRLLVASSVIAGVAVVNHAIFKVNSKKPVSEFPEHFYKFKYGNIRYNVYGEGEPLLLLHSTYVGASLKEWDNVIISLSAHYKVYAIDLLGFGASAKPNISYSSYLYVSLINKFIEDVIKEKVYVAASANSAAFTVVANAFNSNNFKKLLLIAPNGLSNNYPVRHHSKFLYKVLESPLIGTTMYNAFSSKFYFKRFLEKNSFYNPETITSYMINDYNHMAHFGGVNVKRPISSLICGYLDVNIIRHLKEINIPTHIVWGAQNQLNPLKNYTLIKDVNPNIGITIIEDAKIVPQIEKPQEFLKICKDFFGS